MVNEILRLKPLEFAHILDIRENVTVVETGPCTKIMPEGKQIVHGPAKFVIIPPGHYCSIRHPAKLPVEQGKQAELLFGHVVIKFNQDPFPLYPGEEMIDSKDANYSGAIKKLTVITAGNALKLEALMDFNDKGVARVAGDEWQIEGPCTYYPRPEQKIKGRVPSVVIAHRQALHLRAKADLVDKDGKTRVTGEEWLYRKWGSYLPGVFEEVVHLVDGHTLTLNNALHMRAEKNLVDGTGKNRLAGEEWLVTEQDTQLYIPEVGEVVHQEISRTILAKQQFCVVVNPYDSASGSPLFGQRELREGESSFFLKPGEQLESGIQDAYLVQDDQALILRAMEEYTDSSGDEPVNRIPGDVWMRRGPLVYIPPVQVQVMDLRKPIAIAKNEGIYIQNQQTGKVKTVLGPESYLLNEYEKLWQKELSAEAERLLQNGGCFDIGGCGDIRKIAFFEGSIDPLYAKGKRDKTRVITYKVPVNCAVQVFDHQKQTKRVVFGPNLVILGPSEDFNILTLSAGKPKKQFALECLAVMLGPDYMTDIIEVETLDHARLKIMYAANNKFVYTEGDPESENKLFSVPDYIGFATRNIASRIRGCIAKTSFDEFHRYSTKIVMESVFGVDADGAIKKELLFKENNMHVTSIDVQSIEPVDTHMRDSLLKSVQLAIEISTQSIEMEASHEAKRREQEAKGSLERYKLENQKSAEQARKELYHLRAITAAVESSGQAKAEAQAEAEKSLIEGRSSCEVADLRMRAEEIEADLKMETLQKQRSAEIEYTKVTNNLSVDKAKRLAQIETGKTTSLIESIGKNTIQNIALAGPAAQIHMLQGLGIRSTLITDGKTPVNLLQASNGMIQPMIQ